MTSKYGYIPGDIKSTNNGIQTSATGSVVYAYPSGFHVATTTADADNTLTPQQLMGGLILQASTGTIDLTLPTAADMVAFMNGPSNNLSVQFYVRNTGASTITIVQSADASITIDGEVDILTTDTASYLLVFSDVSVGSEAAVCYTLDSTGSHV